MDNKFSAAGRKASFAAPRAAGANSPFSLFGPALREQGLSVIPCGPGTKFPGRYTAADGWWKAHDWQRYSDRLPTPFEADIWDKWPDAGVCLVLGASSAPAGKVLVAVDIDTDVPAKVAAIRSALPGSPVAKRGAKGETQFYLANPCVKNAAFNDGQKRRMLDLLAHGRQTVLPPTIHPDTGAPYYWITPDTLDDFTIADLPELPDDIVERIGKALEPFGYAEPPKLGEAASEDLSGEKVHRALNDAALANLDSWVPALSLYKCRKVGHGYKAVSDWRPSSSGRPLAKRATNLAIRHDGIKDCGENKGYTPLDVVMAATGCDLETAFRWLQERVAADSPVTALTARAAVVSAPPAKSAIPSCEPDEPRLVRTSPKGNLAGLHLVASDGERVDVPEVVELPAPDEIDGWIQRLRESYPEKVHDACGALQRLKIGMTEDGQKGARPVDLWQRHEAPALPAGVLPKVIEDFAASQGELMGADPAGLAMSALAVCGAAITDDITVQVKRHDPSWRESARLWVALVGMPSTKKSPIMSTAMRPLRRVDARMAQENDVARKRYMSFTKAEQAQNPEPKQPRRVVEDATVEALQQVVLDSPHGVISFRDELSGWAGAMDKYSPGKGAAADRAFWLQAFNGGQYAINRVMRGASLIPNLSISLLGGIQPEPLRKMVADTSDDGLIQRFLPVVLRPASVGRDAPMGEAVAAYGDLVEGLTRLAAPVAGNLSGPRPLTFSSGARAVRERLEREHSEMTLSLETVSPKLAGHVGKLDGIFARLCVIWHCVEHSGSELPVEISEDVAERVARFEVEFIRPNAIAFYAGLLGMSAGHEDVMALAALIVSDGLGEISARDIQRSTRAMRHVTADGVRTLCEKLEAFGWLHPSAHDSKGGTKRWRVNAEVHTLFAERGREETKRRAEGRAAVAAAFGN